MLSLAMIVKPTEEEAKLLDRCLRYLKDNVDEICITQAGSEPNEEVSRVIKKYGGKEFFFKWINDFAAARNFSYSQTTGDYIIWADADDVVKGAEKLKPLVQKMKDEAIDAVVMNYLYDFDKDGKCTVKHLKTRVTKRGVVEWVGEIHEDFQPLRQLNSLMTEEIEYLHLTDEKRAERASERNIEVARYFVEKHPGDPRGEWLMANALLGENKPKEAEEYLKRFVKISGSEEEVFIAYLRLGDITRKEVYYLRALGIKPAYPDAYIKLGEFYALSGKLERAKEFLLEGLKKNIPDRSIIVYNPRDYDFNPMMTLANVYFQLREAKNAIEVLKRCRLIYPQDERVKAFEEAIEKLDKEEKAVDEFLKKAEKEKDREKLKKMCDEFEYFQNPRFCIFRNINFVKTETSGKDLVYYCGYTDKVWNPEIALNEGVGGSEEAVVNLAKQWSDAGWNVTVYNNCGREQTFDGVRYVPYSLFNIKDKQDVIILWRHPKPVDFNLNADKILLDLHDVLPEAELTPDRIEKFHKIMVKSYAHRILFPKVPDEKFAVIPNGIDPELFTEKVERNPYLIVNTSSPDRHIDATLSVFERLRELHPDKPWKLEWYYGWTNFLNWHYNDRSQMEYYEKQNARFQKLVQDGIASGGIMISHKEIAKKYLEAGIFLYPTQFYEIDCISATKAQVAGCNCVTSDFAALDEKVTLGYKIHTEGKKWKTENTFGDSDNIDKYVSSIVHATKRSNELVRANHTKDTVKKYNWENISNQWLKEL